MSQFYTELSDRIFENQNYIQARDSLFEAYVLATADEEYELDKTIIRKLATAVQAFYLSAVESYVNEGAALLSMLLFVASEEAQELIAIAGRVFSGAGDFPNVQLLEKLYPEVEFKVSFFDAIESDARRELNSVEAIGHPLTNYQRTLWEHLISDDDVITSAPTSTGKTHIILQYLIQQVAEADEAFVAVVVPTRALIAELSNKVYEIAKSKSLEQDIEICTVPKEGEFKDRTVFVMTQERLFEVLQRGDILFNYLFVDEAHNISDKSRGVLLHLTLQKMLEGSNPQVIVSMPSPRYRNAFDSVFDGVDFEREQTKHSPVAKVIMPVAFKGRNLNISRIGCDRVVTIPKRFKDTKLADVVYRLGKGEQNIVYRNQTDHCEYTASALARIVNNREASSSLEEAADYIERFLHEKFSLASCLRKGVAFHYSPLPGVVRRMVEELARDREVDFVVCTSTLAEGVNLPAKNLFLSNPTQQTPIGERAARLDDVKLDNISGRAGRMLEHFAGNIFLVKHETWDHQDYFDEREDAADKIPTYFKVLTEDVVGVVQALNGRYEHTADEQYTYYTIANKLLKEFDSGVLSVTLNAKELELDRNDKRWLEENIQAAYDALKVDTFTLEANPTVGFIQQNKLYSSLLEQDDLSEWVLPHPKSSDLYDRLVAVCWELFNAGIFLPREAHSIEHVCTIASKWIRGKSIKQIIIDQIAADREYGGFTSYDSSVRNSIKVVNTDVRFRLSSALRCYHSLISSILGPEIVDMPSVKLYSYLEVGGCEDRVINLVNLGLSRETALQVHDTLPKDITVDSYGALRRIVDAGMLESLHAVSKKEVERVIN